MPAHTALTLFDGFENQRFFLGAHAFDGADAADERGPLQIVERLDAELAVEHGHRFRSDTLEAHHLEDRWRKLGEQIAMKLRITGRRNLADLAGEIFPDARNLAQRWFVELGQLVGMIARDIDDVPIGANLERILALDFEEVCNLLEDAGDRGVIQPEGLPSRCESRAVARRPASTRRQSPPGGRAAHNRRDSRRHRRRTPWLRWHPRLRRGASGRRSPAW